MSPQRASAIAVSIAAVLGIVRLSCGDGDDSAGNVPSPAAGRAQALATGPGGAPFAAVERLGRGGPAVEVAGPGDSPRARTGLRSPASLAVDSEGRLIVAGRREQRGRSVVAVTRLTRDGAPDPSFGRAGTATVAAGADDAVVRGVAVRDDGSVVVAADGRDGEAHAALAVSLSGRGEPGGVAVLPDASAAGVALDGAGRALVGATAAGGDALVARIGRDGRLDASYADAGVARLPARLRGTTWRDIAATRDGGALLAGSGRRTSDARSLVAVARVRPDGSAAAAEAVAGEGDAYGTAVAVAADGRALVAGSAARGGHPVVVLRGGRGRRADRALPRAGRGPPRRSGPGSREKLVHTCVDLA